MPKDDPETEYWCPVCDADVKLINVRQHLQGHLIRSQVTVDNEEWVEGLRHVAINVLKEYGIDYYRTIGIRKNRAKYITKSSRQSLPDSPRKLMKPSRKRQSLKAKETKPKKRAKLGKGQIHCPFCHRGIPINKLTTHVKDSHPRAGRSGWDKVKKLIIREDGASSVLLKNVSYTSPPRARLLTGGGTGVGGRKRK